MTALLLAAAFLAAPEAAPAGVPPRSPVTAALAAELDRAMKSLELEDFARPYYISTAVFERRAWLVEAAGGALGPLRESRQRWLRVNVRVGNRKLDNSGFVDQVGGGGSGEGITQFPLDDDPVAMRRVVWLALDDAYKEAGATYAAKLSFLATQGNRKDEGLGDFTVEEPRRSRLERPSAAADRARLEGLARQLAEPLRAVLDPESRFRLYLVERATSFLDSEGTELEQGGTFAALESVAWGTAPDGGPVRDIFLRYGKDLTALGTPEALAAGLKDLLDSVRAQQKAPVLGEPYRGPVLFEGEGSAQLFSALLLGRFDEPREPLTTSGRHANASEWSSRLGSRVLHPALTVVDDPTLESRGPVALIGGYPWDVEGVPGRRVTLVEKGVLRDFLGTRWPRRGAERSNGHARRAGGPPWALGATAMASNLIVTAGEGAVPPAEARRKFLEELKTRGLEYGIAVRHMDDSSILSLGATDWFETGELQSRVHETSPLEMPLKVYRVFPDGREERLRGLRFGPLPIEALRTPLALTGPDAPESIHSAPLTFDVGYTVGGPIASAYVPFSVVAPGILVLEEAELQPLPGPFPTRPIRRAREAKSAAKP